MTRFIYAGPQFTQWANVNHHAAPLGMLLSVGSVYAVTFLEQRIHKKLKWPKKRIVTIIGVYILFVAVAQDVVLHGPINSFFKPQFHETREWMRDNYEIIKKIPPGVSVSAQNSLLPHLSQREEIYLLPEVGEAQYVFVDLEDGPNKFSPLSKIEIEDFINDLIFTGEYIPVRQIGKAMLLQKSSEL
jgi:uncharacterized membrane protein